MNVFKKSTIGQVTIKWNIRFLPSPIISLFWLNVPLYTMVRNHNLYITVTDIITTPPSH